MSEEAENSTNDGTWGGLKKTIIGTLSTAVLGAGTWFTTTFFNAPAEDKAETKTEQTAPAAAPVVINLSNNNEQKQSAAPTTTIIKERVIEKPAKEEKKKEEKPKEEEAPW
jgi:flagellar basal body-associated protein FliL